MNCLRLIPLVVLLLIWTGTSADARQKKNPVIEAAKNWVDEKLVTIPADKEVCFSPDEPCDIKLIKWVRTAKKSIDVAIYDVTLDQFVHELLVASKKIPVRIIADRRQAKGEHSLVPLLRKAGAQIRFGRQRGIMHNKFVIIDQEKVETGSFNYTNNASRNNNENQIYLTDPGIVARYQKQFDKMWAVAFLPTGGPQQ